MTPLSWLLAAGAVYRLTLLVVADRLTAEPRTWGSGRLAEAHPKLAYLITCPWCVSVYIAAATIGVGLAADPAPQPAWGWQLAAGTAALSGVTGFAASFASPD